MTRCHNNQGNGVSQKVRTKLNRKTAGFCKHFPSGFIILADDQVLAMLIS